MDHQEIREALLSLHDGELGDKERREVLAHIETCLECGQEYRRWGQIAGSFFRPPAKPTSRETEFFVSRVMERIDSLDSNVPKPSFGTAVLGNVSGGAPGAWLEWLGARWMIPALSLVFAILLFSIIGAQPEFVAPLDALVLMDSQTQGVREFVLAPDPSNEENLLGFETEEG